MIIKGIKYSRFPGLAREWRIVGKDDKNNESYAEFGNLNLLVGKNAAGKSRTLDAIRELAALMCGAQLVEDTKYHTQHFDFLFTDNGNTYRYVLFFKDREIVEETLYLNDEKIIDREQKRIRPEGETHHTTVNIDCAKLLIAQKRGDDSYYFPKLIFWGAALRTFMFSDQLEKNKAVKDLHILDEVNDSIENVGLVIPIFHWGCQDYGQEFEDAILESMNTLGYNLTDIAIKQGRKGYSINVEEDGKYTVSQQEMSQGMFRALALFVLLENAIRRSLSVCIIVDDIGEGLDHERAKAFMDLIVKKTHDTQVQYFMSSNDRYVMNNIHLKYWTIIERQNEKSVFYNRNNSKKNFEDFKYTGLNNFDFFTTDFYRDGFGEDESIDEEEYQK